MTTPLANRLEQLGMSQRDLCKLTGLSEGAISLLVNGLRDPLMPNAHKIAEALGTDIAKLFPPSKGG